LCAKTEPETGGLKISLIPAVVVYAGYEAVSGQSVE